MGVEVVLHFIIKETDPPYISPFRLFRYPSHKPFQPSEKISPVLGVRQRLNNFPDDLLPEKGRDKLVVAGQTICDVTFIAGKGFITAIAVQSYGDVLAGKL
jgi:hypothetical protein